jgi:hypothetical protein
MATLTADPKTILITITVKPPKSGKRPITVSAAPEGEMPLLLTGQFSERHQLLDQIFAELLKRKPKVVTKTEATKKAKVKEDRLGNLSTEAKEPEASDQEEPEAEAPADDTETPAAPDAVRACRACGCTDEHACEGGCYWVEKDLCSACQDKAEPDRPVRSEGLPTIEGDDAPLGPADAEALEANAETLPDEPPAETEIDELEDPNDRNAPSAQPAPDEDGQPDVRESVETQTTLF